MPVAAPGTDSPASTVTSDAGVWNWTVGGAPTVTLFVTRTSAPIPSFTSSVTVWTPSEGWITTDAPADATPSTVHE